MMMLSFVADVALHTGKIIKNGHNAVNSHYNRSNNNVIKCNT